MTETHQAHHSSSYSRTFLYCQVNSNLPAVSPSCSNTAADASLSCSVAGQGTVVWWNTCLWKQNKANICLLPCAEHSYGRNRVKKNNAKQLCRDAPSSSHLDNWSFDIIKRRRMSRNSLLLKNPFIGLLLPWLAFYLHAFLGPVMMIMKDTLREGLCIICGGRWSMACFNLPSWLHSAEKQRTSEELAGDYSVAIPLVCPRQTRLCACQSDDVESRKRVICGVRALNHLLSPQRHFQSYIGRHCLQERSDCSTLSLW